MTNAVRHAGEREIRVRFTRESRGMLLEVWDASDDKPLRRRPLTATSGDTTPDAAALEAGHDATGGRGLPIVEALASEGGVLPTKPHGKRVWARAVI